MLSRFADFFGIWSPTGKCIQALGKIEETALEMADIEE